MENEIEIQLPFDHRNEYPTTLSEIRGNESNDGK